MLRASSPLPAVLLLVAASGCSSGRTVALASDGGGVGSAPATEACAGAQSECLWGTAATQGFDVAARGLEVQIYSVFPSAGSSPVATMPVALDGTWAVSGLTAPGAHYYAQVLADFGQPHSIAALVGPLTLPATGPTALVVRPVQVTVLEEVSAGAATLGWIEAHVYAPSTGAELTGTAGLTVNLPGAVTSVPWAEDGAGVPAYFLDFPAGTPAAATYSGFVSIPGEPASKPALAWSLVATTPAFTPALGAPADGATIPVGQPIDVSWTAQPLADYVLVQLFVQQDATWQPVYASPSPEAPSTSTEAIPGTDVASAGSYLLDLDMTNASCPPTATGCVLASAIADAQLTAQ